MLSYLALVKDLLGIQLRARKAERDQSNVGYLDERDQDVELNMGQTQLNRI